MTLDVVALRAQFPSLSSGISHFDGPGGTQTPLQVAAAVSATLSGPLSNRGRQTLAERNADDAVANFRAAFSDFLGVPPEGVVYGRSATQITYDFSRHLAKGWAVGDEIVVSRIEHDSNIRPWIQAAERAGAIVRWIDFDPDTAEIIPESVTDSITAKTRLVAISAASNVLGTKPNIPAIAAATHSVGALLYVDGVHYAAHSLVDMNALGADLFVCSPYKFLGPHCAVLGASPELLETVYPDKLLPSTNVVPERFEFGTLPYELLNGATAAVDFLADLSSFPSSVARRERLAASYREMESNESRLRLRIEDGLKQLDAPLRIHSRAASRTPTLLITIPGYSMTNASEFLARRNVLAPAGSFYAYEAFAVLGLAEPVGLRVGLSPYNVDEDVDRLITGLQGFLDATSSREPSE